VAKRGPATVTVCSSAFVKLGRAQASACGFPDLPIAVVPHPFSSRTREEVRALAAKCADDIVRLVCGGDTAASSETPAHTPSVERAAHIEIPDDLHAINAICMKRRWGDGLPVIPPTPERVAAMLRGTRRRPDDIVARIAPGFGAATVELIAINAVLAGCEPEYLPVLVAATAAAAAREFNLQGLQTTTDPVAVWLIVNGPIAQRLQINGGANCLGQGAWANATIGRALRLILQNVGGALPGEMDRATQGQPGKYTFCCAENEASSPWLPLHVERGFALEQSTVTVVGAEGTMNMHSYGKNADDLLRVFADTMAHGPSNEYVHGGEPWLMLCPEHAEILHHAGYSKADVQRKLWELSKMAADRMTPEDFGRAQASRSAALGAIGPDTLLPIAPAPAGIALIVAGGPGAHTVYVPSFGNTRSVTREIVDDALKT
jgi:hypothetical protein